MRGGYTPHVDDYIKRSIAYCQAAKVFCRGDLLVQIGYIESVILLSMAIFIIGRPLSITVTDEVC